MEQITGIVKTIIYTNESNGYTICQIKEGRKAHTLVGTMPLLMPGESIIWVNGRPIRLRPAISARVRKGRYLLSLRKWNDILEVVL